jgi:transcription initiation factor TFIID subunit TAF12
MGPMDEDFIDVVSNSAESYKMVSHQQQQRQQQHQQQQQQQQRQQNQQQLQRRRESSSSMDRLDLIGGIRESGSAFQPVFPTRGGSSR